jgi:hypothetical protein
MYVPNLEPSTSNALVGDNRHHAQPQNEILEHGQILVQPSLYIEPVYWRCSNAECNPDGVQGWLTKIGDVSTNGLRAVDKVSHPGYTLTQIAHHYRTRLSFIKLDQDDSRQWHEIHAPHGGDGDHALPVAERSLVFPRSPSTKGPCDCSQDHTSILYSYAKTPLGLLGGLCFNTERLMPYGWSCCIHCERSGPMPLS